MLCHFFDLGKQFAALQLQNLATVWRQHALDDLMKEPEVKKRESKEMRDQAAGQLADHILFVCSHRIAQPQDASNACLYQ